MFLWDKAPPTLFEVGLSTVMIILCHYRGVQFVYLFVFCMDTKLLSLSKSKWLWSHLSDQYFSAGLCWEMRSSSALLSRSSEWYSMAAEENCMCWCAALCMQRLSSCYTRQCWFTPSLLHAAREMQTECGHLCVDTSLIRTCQGLAASTGKQV